MSFNVASSKVFGRIVRTIAVSLPVLATLTASASPPLRDPTKLWGPRLETVLQLQNARVILADYPLIRADFPEIAGKTDAQIDKWLVDKTGYLSIQQVAQQETNSKVPVTGKAIKAFRPREYGRAHVFRAGRGLIDAKGSGGIDPHMGFERTGLATVGEMLREFMMEKLISKVFKHIGKYETVPCYAVLDLGFSAKGSGTNDQDVPAGMVLRRAHVRHHEGVIGKRQREDPVVLPTKLQLGIELALRRYGITSSIGLDPGHPYKNTRPGDQLNIQGDENGAVVDFAGFRIKRRFYRSIYSSYDKKGNAVVSDADILLRPGDKGFVQPDRDLKIPYELWGSTVSEDMQDNTTIWSEELAAELESGKADTSHVQDYYHRLMDPVDAKLNKSASSCSAAFGG